MVGEVFLDLLEGGWTVLATGLVEAVPDEVEDTVRLGTVKPGTDRENIGTLGKEATEEGAA